MRIRKVAELSQMSVKDLKALRLRVKDLAGNFNPMVKEEVVIFNDLNNYRVKVEEVTRLKKLEEKEKLTSCQVFQDVKDLVNDDMRKPFLYNPEEVAMLEDYGYIIQLSGEAIEIEDAERYTRRKG